MAPDTSGPQTSGPGDGDHLAPMTTQVNLSRPGSVSPLNHTNPTQSPKFPHSPLPLHVRDGVTAVGQWSFAPGYVCRVA